MEIPFGPWTIHLTLREDQGDALVVGVESGDGSPIQLVHTFEHDREPQENQRLNAVFQTKAGKEIAGWQAQGRLS